MKKFLMLFTLLLSIAFIGCTLEEDSEVTQDTNLTIAVDDVNRSYNISEMVAQDEAAYYYLSEAVLKFKGTDAERNAHLSQLIEIQQRGADDCGPCFEMTDGTCRQDCWDGSAWQSRPCVCECRECE